MLFTTFTIGEKEYKARLTTKAVIELERKLGTNPVNVLLGMASNENQLPNLETLLMFLHASLKTSIPGLTIDETYGIYDEMIEEGKDISDLINLIVSILQESGLAPSEAKNPKKGK